MELIYLYSPKLELVLIFGTIQEL